MHMTDRDLTQYVSGVVQCCIAFIYSCTTFYLPLTLAFLVDTQGRSRGFSLVRLLCF